MLPQGSFQSKQMYVISFPPDNGSAVIGGVYIVATLVPSHKTPWLNIGFNGTK